MAPHLPPAVAAAIREVVGDPDLVIAAARPIVGGCISHAARVTTSIGELFVKWNAACPPDLFEREADGLRALAGVGAQLAIPYVFGTRVRDEEYPALIAMEYLPPGEGGDRTDDARLGLGLATIHRQSAAAFGFDTNTYCGATEQHNAWHEDWVQFYGAQRIGWILGLIAQRHGTEASWRRPFDRLLDRLPDLLAHDPQPALIHGDLWSGNVLASERGPALVDPACAYADREMEMGIATMFGGFSSRFWDAYDDAWPLPAEWRERNPIYQLYHILNHYYLFGGHYGADALRVARAFI